MPAPDGTDTLVSWCGSASRGASDEASTQAEDRATRTEQGQTGDAAHQVATALAVLTLHLEAVRRQAEQLRLAARWINGQSLGLATGAQAPFAPGGAGEEGDVDEVLTPRELEVIELIARGMSNGRIAETLVVGEGTVKYHVKNVLRKLGARSRAEAVSRYMRRPGSHQ